MFALGAIVTDLRPLKVRYLDVSLTIQGVEPFTEIILPLLLSLTSVSTDHETYTDFISTGSLLWKFDSARRMVSPPTEGRITCRIVFPDSETFGISPSEVYSGEAAPRGHPTCTVPCLGRSRQP